MRALACAILLGVSWLGGCRPEAPPPTSGAYEALAFWHRQRAYPRAELPPEGLYRAHARERLLPKRAAGPDAETAPWRPLGPHNIGGRTLDLVVNPARPATLYAGAASGGLWRSYTGGLGPRAWHRVETGFPVLGVSAIALAPDDTATVYIGTGEVYNYRAEGRGVAFRPTRGSYGLGVLKSTDGGQTWRPVLDWSYDQRRGVQRLFINPLRSRSVWAATTEGLLASYDAGASWQTALDAVMVTDVAMHPADTSTVFAAVGNLGSPGHGLYRSRDGGRSWQKMEAGLPTTYAGKALLTIWEGDAGVVYASIGNGFRAGVGTWMARSLDAGDTWEVVSTEDYASFQGWFSHTVSLDPRDHRRLVAAGVYVWRSEDGGRTLARNDGTSFNDPHPPIGQGAPSTYVHPDVHAVVRDPSDPEVVYFATDGGVFRSDDGGRTSVPANGGYQTVQFYKGLASSHQDSVLTIGGLQDNGSILYDGTPRWRFISGGDGNWAAFDPRDDRRSYVTAQWLRLYRAENGGADVAEISPPWREPTAFIAPFALAPSAPDVLYAGRDLVFRSPDRGTTWRLPGGARPLDPGNPILTLAVAPFSPDVVFAATAPLEGRARLFRTTDGGATWADATGALPDRYLMDIAFDPFDERTAYVAVSGYGTPHIFKTTDGGATWQASGEGLPDLPASAVLVDPRFPEHVYAGTDLGVYLSTDAGATWARYGEGLPEAVIAMDLHVAPVSGRLRLGTHGNGVYERRLASDAMTPPAAERLRLHAPYPNPSAGRTLVRFELPEAAAVRLAVYDVQGREVAVLAEGPRSAGRHTAAFDGGGLAAGVYVCRLEAGGVTAARTFVRVR